MKKLFLLIFFLVLTSCGINQSSTGNLVSTSQETDFSKGFTGLAQKGPLIFGSDVTVFLLDKNLNTTGLSYDTQTTDDLGNFSFNSPINSNLVELNASGYYFDEIAGALSTSPITLRAIADLSINATPTVNILTTLQAPRVKALITQGKTYSQALQQSAAEVLSVFEINVANISNFQALYGMQINGNQDEDAALLAASVVLSQMSTDAATITNSSQAAQMSFFLSRIASDVANYGKLKDPAINQALLTAETEVNKSKVRSNVETYYASRGSNILAPKFEEWIDSDANGILPLRLNPVSNFSFVNASGVQPNSVVTSNTATVAGLASGVYSLLSVSSGTTIIKNGTVLIGNTATVKNGDTITLRMTSAGYGLTNTTNVVIGSTTTTWQVKSTQLIGTISNLIGSGLIIKDNLGDSLSVPAGATSFTIPSSIANGTSYSISVSSNPNSPLQYCAVANGSGVVGSTNAALSISCSSSELIYAVSESGLTSIDAYFISTVSGAVSFLGSTNAQGTSSNIQGFYPYYITAHPNGKFLYVTDRQPNFHTIEIYSINNATGQLTNIGSQVLPNAATSSIAIDPTGNYLYVMTSGIFLNVFSILSTGKLQALSASSSSTFFSYQQPNSIVFEPSGRYAFSANTDSTISTLTLNMSTGALTNIGSTQIPMIGLKALAVDPNSKFVYVLNPTSIVNSSNSESISVFALNLNSGALTPASNTLISNMAVPQSALAQSIFTNSSGTNLYFSGATNNSLLNLTSFTVNLANGSLASSGSTNFGTSGNPIAGLDPLGLFVNVFTGSNSYQFTVNQSNSNGSLTNIGSSIANNPLNANYSQFVFVKAATTASNCQNILGSNGQVVNSCGSNGGNQASGGGN